MNVSFSNLLITLSIILCGCSAQEKPVKVHFEGDLSKHMRAIKQLNPDLPSDWSSYGFLTFEFNSSTTQRFDLVVHDSGGNRRVVIQPFQGAWVRASVPLIHFQSRNTRGSDMAAIGKTARPGYWIGFTGSLGSIKKVDSLGVAMRQPIGNPTLEIRDIHMSMAPEDSILSPVPLVDEFGQWIPADWPGKARTLNDLTAAWNAEEAALKPGDFEVSIFGGFLESRAKPTGFFRIERIDGKWWFVDPEGYLFFSAGSTCIGTRSSDFARIQGREYIFSAFPPVEVSASANLTGRSGLVSFYSWNLYRRFGADWYRKWMDLTVRRMDSWGLNTIANWSDPALGRIKQKPYVATLGGWGIGSGNMGMPDVYAPDYLAIVDSAAAKQCKPIKNDPYLLGYFIGNEPPWPGREQELANVILQGSETPMQDAMKNYLSKGDTPERRKAFIYETYTKFISIVDAAIKKYDPNHLNMGMRFGGSPPEDLIRASKDFFDVFSVNIYGYSAKHDLLQRIYEITALPVIIGEFHFGTPGRGLAPGLAQTASLAERGVAYRYYVENAAAHPALIGTHWFQWIDQPSTGRYDGENYNIGFVNVTDQPYSELVAAAKETFRRLYDVHSGKEPPFSRQPLRQ